MVEFPQSVPNLTESSTNLFEIIKGRNLAAYADVEIRLAVSRAVALETSRGWRIAKEKQSHKIDVVVALAMAALGAVASSGGAEMIKHLFELMEHQRQPKAPEPNEYREDPLGWKEYGRSQAPQRMRVCRHCQREIGDNTPYNQEPSGPFNGGLPFYSHPTCAMRALAGLN
jgi:hypothetical protein